MIARRLLPLFLSLLAAAPAWAGPLITDCFDSSTTIPNYMWIGHLQDEPWAKNNFSSLNPAEVNKATWTNERTHSGGGAVVAGLTFNRLPTGSQPDWGVSDILYLTSAFDGSAVQALIMYVYVESNPAQNNGNPFYPLYGKFYIKAGSGWTWYDGGQTPLRRGQWNKVVINFNSATDCSTDPCGNNVSIPASSRADIKRVGLQVQGGDYDQGSTRLFVDSLEYSTVAGVFGDDQTPPGTPSGFSASNAATGNRVSLSWTSNPDVDHYNIYRSRVSGSFDAQSFVKSVSSFTTVNVPDESVVDGVAYYYRLRAVDKSGNESVTGADAGPVTPSGPAAYDLADKAMTYAVWSTGSYLSVDSDSSLDDLMSTGADYVALLVTWYQAAKDSLVIAPNATKTPTDAAVAEAIRDIHARGMKVMLKPHVDVDDTTWRGYIEPSTSTVLSWFASYASFINHYADISDDEGVEMLCVGTELKTMTDNKKWKSLRSADWQSIIAGVRARYPGGLLTYAANAAYPQDEFSQIEFWDDLDFVGLNAWWKLTPTTNPALNDIKAAWSRNREDISPLQATVDWKDYTGKDVVITEIGAVSADGTNISPANYTNLTAASPSGLQEQRDVYEAGFAAFNHRSWVKGLFWWHWDPNPNGGGKYSNYYVPNDKPVLDLLTERYGGENTGLNFRYTFEGSTQGWTSDYSAFFRDNLSTPTAQGSVVHGGAGALAYPLTFIDPISGDISDFAFVEPRIRKDLESYKGLKAYVRVPGGVISDEQNNPLKVALVVQTGSGYDWYESNTARFLSSGQWREVSIDFRSAKRGSDSALGVPVPNLHDIRRIGLSVFGAGATGGGPVDFYVDDVVARATYTVIGLSLNTTNFFLYNAPPLGSAITPTSLDFENAGNVGVKYSFDVSNGAPFGWTPSDAGPGPGVFTLNGMFNSVRPSSTTFVEPTHSLTIAPQTAGGGKFENNPIDPNYQTGDGVIPGDLRNFWLEFRAPSITLPVELSTQTFTIGVTVEPD